MCIKEPRVLLVMLPLTLGLAAVDAQLAACERAVCGGGWVGSEASGGGGFSAEDVKLIAEMMLTIRAKAAFDIRKDPHNGFSRDTAVEFLEKLKAQKKKQAALIEKAYASYSPEQIARCQTEAQARVDRREW